MPGFFCKTEEYGKIQCTSCSDKVECGTLDTYYLYKYMVCNVDHFDSVIPVVHARADGWFPRRWSRQKPASELLRYEGGAHRSGDLTLTPR